MKIKNPIIPGFYPDPSICRCGNDYYLVTSSFEYFPGVPIFHSRDLVNWTQIGHCLTRKQQLNLDKCPPSRGIYAATIQFHDGLFYVATTNVTSGGNFYVHAKDPAGQWSYPVWVDQPGIDPSLFFDDDGTVYFTTSENQQSEIDIKTGKRLTDIKKTWPGIGAGCLEAPRLYKINGMYYSLAAEGGTSRGHMVTIARSASPWGKFEQCPHNPILTNRDHSELQIQAAGHGDMIQSPDGKWWMIFLGIRENPGPFPQCHHLGRETFLAPIEWTDDNWPIVNKTGLATIEIESEHLAKQIISTDPVRDDFDDTDLKYYWNFLRNPNENNYTLSQRPGSLGLLGSAVTLDQQDSPTLLARRQQHFKCKVSTLIDFEPASDNQEAGLTVRMNESHHYEIAVTSSNGQRAIIVRRTIGDLSAIVATEPISQEPLQLIIDAQRDKYTFSYMTDNQTEKKLAQGLTRYLSTEVATGFTGVYFAIYATGNGKPCTQPAFFDWFEYTPLS